MRGAMQAGLSYFFNGGTPSQGPTNCTFDVHVDGAISPDGTSAGVLVLMLVSRGGPTMMARIGV